MAAPHEFQKLIDAESDLRREPIDVPQWPSMAGKLFIRMWTAAEREKLRQKKTGATEIERMHEKVAALSLCDEHGTRIYGDTGADLDRLSAKGFAALDVIFKTACKLNLAFEEEVENEKKGLSKTGAGSSPSDWPDSSAAPTSTASSAS